MTRGDRGKGGPEGRILVGGEGEDAMKAPHELTAREAADAIAAGRLSSEALVRSCLARIDEIETDIRAWAHVNRDGALAAARLRDSEPPRGPLHGVPIGIKDVIDTADMPTAYGTSYYAGFRPPWDAACVTLLKRAGAVILGKTVTTELALGGQADNANPWNPAHTAGGSSGGSCAAVAANMVPLAIGSQTAGSLIRPASYNGVVALKPTFGMVSVAGFKYFNGLFDTIGLIGRTVDDVALLWFTLLGVRPKRPTAPAAARVGICRTPWWDRAEPVTRAAVETAAERLAAHGARVGEVTMPDPFDSLVTVHESIQAFESARSYAYEYDAFRDRLHPNTRAVIEAGLAIPYPTYQRLAETAARARIVVESVLADYDFLLAPSAPGEAPAGHTNLGDSFLNRPWTLLHLPCLNMPGLLGPTGLPVGVQMIGRWGSDERLLAHARWVEERIRG